MSIVASITVAWQNVTVGGDPKTIETDIASDNEGSPPNFTTLDGAIQKAREVLDSARTGSDEYGIKDVDKVARAHITLHPGNYIITDSVSDTDFKDPNTGDDDVFVTALPGARIEDNSSNFNIGDAESVIGNLDILTRVLLDRNNSTLSVFEDLIASGSVNFEDGVTFEDAVVAQNQVEFSSTTSFGDTITIQGSDVDQVTSNSNNASSTALLTAAGIDDKVPSDTDDLNEGSTNEYYTAERARDDVGTALVGGNDISINVDDAADTITVALDGDLASVAPEIQEDDGTVVSNAEVLNFTELLNVSSPTSGEAEIEVDGSVFDTNADDTDDITEGSSNLFFTEDRVFSSNQSQLVGGTSIEIVENTNNNQFTFNFTGTPGASVSDNGTQVLAAPTDLNFGTDLGADDDGDGTVTINFTGNLSGVSPNVEEDGTEVESDVAVLNFTTLLDVSNPTSGEVDIEVVDDLSQYDNSTSGFISGVTVDNDGNEVATDVSTFNFGSDFIAVDQGGGEVSVNVVDPRTDVSDDGTQVAPDVSDINFSTNLDVTDDGDGSVTISAAGGISGIDVDDSGVDVATSVDNLNFGDNLDVTDNGSGTVTIDGAGSGGSATSVSDDGTEIVSDVADIDFTGDVTASDDGDGTVTVELENNTITVAGNTASLGGSAEVALTDLSNINQDGDSRPEFPDLPSIATSTTPSKSSDLTTKAYVDGIAQGLTLKESVRVATDGTNVDLTSSSDPNPIDGVTLNDGDRVLLKDQNTASENGIYVANTATNPSTWTRSEDANEDSEVTSGTFTFVEEGTENGSTSYIITTPDPITVGSTDINWSQFSAAGEIEAGNGLEKSGQTLNVSLPVEDSGTSVGSGFKFNFGTNLTVTDDGGGSLTIDASGSSDTRTNVSDDGVEIVSGVEDINFGTELEVVDDGDGTVTVNSTYDVEVQDDGSSITTEASLINFNDLLEASNPSAEEIEVNGVDTVQQARGTVTFSGDGAQTEFVITHGLGYVPRQWFVEATTDDASNPSHTSADTETITVFYDTAPPSGTDNIVLKYATDLKSPDSGGQELIDGDGVQIQFQIPHNLGETPSEWFVEAASEDARGISSTDADSTNIIVNYDTPPASGTDNVALNYAAFVQDPNTFSGDGAQTQFQIPHGFSQTPNDWHVEPVTDDASGFFHTTANDTFVTVNYGTAPPSGTDNIKFNLDARL